MDRTFWPFVLLLAVVFALFETTGIDLLVQDHLYDFSSHTWLVDKNAAVPRLLFYDAPKVVVIGMAIALVAMTLVRNRWTTSPLPGRRDLLVAALTLALAPGIIAVSKATTDVYCPYQITRYGGEVPYRKVLEPFPEGAHPRGRGRGFPAGHASGGFALVALAGLFRRRTARLAMIAVSQAAGWSMGIYQMLKGAHYLSHTVFTAVFCWLVFLGLRRAFGVAESDVLEAPMPACDCRAARSGP